MLVCAMRSLAGLLRPARDGKSVGVPVLHAVLQSSGPQAPCTKQFHRFLGKHAGRTTAVGDDLLAARQFR